jgi:hypothetical protein
MLLLPALFTVVSLLFIYALMRDTGKHTRHARLQERRKQSQNHQHVSPNRPDTVTSNAEATSLV